MPLCKILVDYQPMEGWGVGDVVDITNPRRLIEEGKVELYVEEKPEADSADTDSKAAGSKSSKKKSK